MPCCSPLEAGSEGWLKIPTKDDYIRLCHIISSMWHVSTVRNLLYVHIVKYQRDQNCFFTAMLWTNDLMSVVMSPCRKIFQPCGISRIAFDALQGNWKPQASTQPKQQGKMYQYYQYFSSFRTIELSFSIQLQSPTLTASSVRTLL